MIRRIRELTRATKDLYDKIADSGQTGRAAAARRTRDRGAARRQVHRRDRRHRPLQHRRATRPPRRLRADPRLLRTHRPPPPRSRRQPPPQQRLLHARDHPDQPRPPHRGLPRTSNAPTARPTKKRSAASNAISSAVSTTSYTTQQRPDHHLLDIGALSPTRGSGRGAAAFALGQAEAEALIAGVTKARGDRSFVRPAGMSLARAGPELLKLDSIPSLRWTPARARERWSACLLADLRSAR